MSLSLYDVLDVEPTASDADIRAAWKQAIADLEPADRRFRLLNQAAEVLLDPARRATYDRGLGAPEPSPEPETTPPPPPPPEAPAADATEETDAPADHRNQSDGAWAV